MRFIASYHEGRRVTWHSSQKCPPTYLKSNDQDKVPMLPSEVRIFAILKKTPHNRVELSNKTLWVEEG